MVAAIERALEAFGGCTNRCRGNLAQVDVVLKEYGFAFVAVLGVVYGVEDIGEFRGLGKQCVAVGVFFGLGQTDFMGRLGEYGLDFYAQVDGRRKQRAEHVGAVVALHGHIGHFDSSSLIVDESKGQLGVEKLALAALNVGALRIGSFKFYACEEIIHREVVVAGVGREVFARYDMAGLVGFGSHNERHGIAGYAGVEIERFVGAFNLQTRRFDYGFGGSGIVDVVGAEVKLCEGTAKLDGLCHGTLYLHALNGLKECVAAIVVALGGIVVAGGRIVDAYGLVRRVEGVVGLAFGSGPEDEIVGLALHKIELKLIACGASGGLHGAFVGGGEDKVAGLGVINAVVEFLALAAVGIAAASHRCGKFNGKRHCAVAVNRNRHLFVGARGKYYCQGCRCN